jgi:very-short-patch-repair endonuclease
LAESRPKAEGINGDSSNSPSVDCKPVFDKIDQWKKDLIDLSHRNRLLFLKEKQAERQVEITSPSLHEILDALVGKDASMDFPMPIYNQLTLEASAPDPASEPQEQVREGDVETNLPPAELQRRLGRLRRDQLTSQEEQGTHTLFLATGFLRWDEKPSSEGELNEYLAPIILVPVGLDRKSVDDPYFMKLSEEDVVVNPALIFKLKTEFGISLPELPDELNSESVSTFLDQVERVTKDLGWQVVRSVRLGKFTYEKFVMYNDLTDHREDGCHQPIISALAKASALPAGDDIQVPNDLDEVVNPKELFPLLDADSSQMEVLLRFNRGQNLVIQGPPGTGKSQTIANLISQGLRDGKKILFVSEKMAALEVVNRRLQAAGLSFACLEVHSHKSDKLKVVQELAKTLTQAQNVKIELEITEKYQKLIGLRDLLNEYVRELHKVRGGLKVSAFQVHGRLARLLSTPRVEFRLPVNSALQMRPEQLDELRGALHRVKNIGNVFDDYEHHPWKGVVLRTADDSGSPLDDSLFVDDVTNVLNSLGSELVNFRSDLTSFTTRVGAPQPATIRGTEGFMKAVELLSSPRVVADSWTRLPGEELGNLTSAVEELRKLNRQLAVKRADLEKGFKLDLLGLPISEILTRFEHEYRTPLRFLKSRYRSDLRMLQQYHNSIQKIGYGEATKAISTAKEILDIKAKLESGYAGPKAALGQPYQGEETDWDSIIGRLEWLSRVLASLGLSKASDQLRELMQHPDQLSPLAEGAQTKLRAGLSKITERIGKLEWAMNSYTIEGSRLAQAPFPSLESWLKLKALPQDLRDWLSYQKATDACQGLGLTHFLAAAKENQITAKNLDDVFMQRIWKAWVAETYREAPILNNFMAASHERIINEFQKVDEDLKSLTVEVVRQNVAKSQPRAEVATVGASQMGIILREARKKRRVMPLRKLFAEAPHLIQDLKPCMLMSPLSVASYLGTSPYRFDWVIFDEASQIPPADSVGAILRGTHLIVAGDDKQLPPTTFFQAEADFDEESNEALEEPLESILDECLTLPGFKRVFLKWHYRSKREELIDFSNRNFYDGELVTFPSPDSRDAAPAIEFRYVNDGVYDRGGSRTNVQEARAVCDLIEDHFRQYGAGLSLGVITLGIAQEEAIWDELDRRKIENPTLAAQSESNEVEPLFIKSLEKVQGDERDFIIISLGYGKDTKGILSLNFGPINKAGGERRLNVAVTRAKEKVTLVSSILPQDMDLTRLSTRSRGVTLLAKYLEYAQQGGRLPTQTYVGGEPESDFEYDVRDHLLERGFDVDAQVGCSGFRIDLAIKNPEHKDRYILGIECDGATYHSQRSARDRDRLRQAVLERLGWRIYRVWSTEWVKNPDRIVASISEKVRELEESGPLSAGVPGTAGAPLREAPTVQPVEPEQNEPNGRNQPPKGSSESTQYGFKPYVEYRQLGKRPNDVGYLAKAIVQTETPIHIDALVHRIAEAYNIGVVGSRTRGIIMQHIRQAANRRLFQIRGNFCWIGDDATPRVPQNAEAPRPIQEIALEELKEAARRIVKIERGVPRESLVREVGRVFGFRRTGERVDTRIQQAIAELLKEGVFSNYGDQVILSAKAP